MTTKSIFAAAAAIAITASAAYALSVNFDPATGGFVGKGDVKDALGWSENQVRTMANQVEFTYEDSVEYAVPCVKENSAQVMYRTFKRQRDVYAVISYEARKNSNGILTGFMLSPAMGSGELEGNVECPGGWEADGEPEIVGSSDLGGGLKVNGVLLPITPAY